ncbi:C-X-C motif chemokine 10 isoform X1 [Paralichthys olivaceus]|uniref:C-X-C motif chemokine 10 isoform X1 n=1 Tax=Paralichthys olivaceus TaxID=8255 RepID=UPI00375094D5
MMKLQKPLLVLAALTLCCCIDTLHAFRQRGCHCIRTTPDKVPVRFIKKLEVIPISGQCRRTEIIITKRNGYKLCVAPEEKWIKDLLGYLQSSPELTKVRPQCLNHPLVAGCGKVKMRRLTKPAFQPPILPPRTSDRIYHHTPFTYKL